MPIVERALIGFSAEESENTKNRKGNIASDRQSSDDARYKKIVPTKIDKRKKIGHHGKEKSGRKSNYSKGIEADAAS